jgi:hypothetical protein
MEREDNDYLQRLKHRAFLLGLDLCGCIRSQVEGDKRTRIRSLKRGLQRLGGPNSGTYF